MKRFYLFCLLVLTSIPMQAKNKISMVTYFPVPYVAYSQVNTTEQMDIGLTNTCDMKLGCSETSATLNAARVNLNGGKLNLDGGRGIKGYTVSLGNGSGAGRISFQNVRIQTGTMESVNAQDTQVTNLNLFGKTFPSCKSANSESGGQMQWTSLKLKGASSKELYLMCGNVGESSVCQPTDSRGATYTENCPTGQTGGPITYTWNYSLCRYIKSGSCTQGGQYTCIVSYQWKKIASGMSQEDGCDGEAKWNQVHYNTSMVCGGETSHHSGTKTFAELEDCTPGAYYLYMDTLACAPTAIDGRRCNPVSYGYYCLKCGTVSKQSDCVTKISSPVVVGASCSVGGGSGPSSWR